MQAKAAAATERLRLPIMESALTTRECWFMELMLYFDGVSTAVAPSGVGSNTREKSTIHSVGT